MEIKTIVFLTSSHSPFDDRIFYHQAKSLSKKYRVVIISNAENINLTVDNITILSDNSYTTSKKKKIAFFQQSLAQFKPEIVICSEPLPILAALKYKRKLQKKVKIIYDITEWYPSKKNLEGLPFIKKIFTFFKLLYLNIYVSLRCDGFIFGEYFKSLPFRFLFPYKKWVIVSYFPDLNYINCQESKLVTGKICLGYTGKISVEKGIENFFAVATSLKRKRPDIAVKLKIIGWCSRIKDKELFEKLCREIKDIEVELLEKQDFEKFSDQLLDIDILFDLRELDFENNHCLAIKVFYYAACGKPVIYSDIKAIRREIDVNKFGYFVDPVDSEIISDYVINYIENPELYINHSLTARQLAETTYNWENIEPQFVDFVNKFQS